MEKITLLNEKDLFELETYIDLIENNINDLVGDNSDDRLKSICCQQIRINISSIKKTLGI